MNKRDSSFSLKGVNLIINQGVFSPDPRKTNSSLILLNNLPDLKAKEVLDMGCGSGVIGIYCALNGAKRVVFTDSEDAPLENTKKNIQLNNVESVTEVIKSDLFENISGSFDYIFANLPISDRHWNLSMSTLDLIKKFISESQKYIKPEGGIYFVWASFSPVEPVRDFLKLNKYHFEEISERRLNRVWHLFKLFLC